MSAAGRLVLVSGPIGAGKTTFCLAALAWAGERGWQVAGLVSPPVLNGGIKVGIDAVDLRSGERRRLARRRTGGSGVGVATASWVFEPETLRWGDQVLAKALPCDLLVVDELGPLEFKRGQGWLAGLTALDSRQYRLGLASIRPELLDLARSRWPDALIIEVAGADSGPVQAAHLLERLANDSSSDPATD